MDNYYIVERASDIIRDAGCTTIEEYLSTDNDVEEYDENKKLSDWKRRKPQQNTNKKTRVVTNMNENRKHSEWKSKKNSHENVKLYKKKRVAFGCDRFHGTCVPLANGPYKTKQECENTCVGLPEDVMYYHLDPYLNIRDRVHLTSTTREEYNRLQLNIQYDKMKQLLGLLQTPTILYKPGSQSFKDNITCRVFIKPIFLDEELVFHYNSIRIMQHGETLMIDTDDIIEYGTQYLLNDEIIFLQQYASDEKEFFIALLAVMYRYGILPYATYYNNMLSKQTSAMLDDKTVQRLRMLFSIKNKADKRLKLLKFVETDDEGTKYINFKTRFHENLPATQHRRS